MTLTPRELVGQTEHSPGPVACEERLRRLCFCPTDIDEKGALKREAISVTDLSERGWSLQREQFFGSECLATFVAARVARGHRHVGDLFFLCGDARRLLDQSGARMVEIVDCAATVDLRAHASLYAYGNRDRARCKEIRDRLTELCGPVVAVGS